MEIVTFTSLFPNSVSINHGVFVANRLDHLLRTGRVSSRVVAPVPWFPLGSEFFGRYGALARVPLKEVRLGLPVLHPRFPVLPKVGMTIAPTLLFAACLPVLKRLIRERDFDLIDAHYFYPDGIAAAMLGCVLGKPVIITARGTDINQIPQHFFARRQILWAGKRAAALIAVSHALKDAMVGLGIAADKITVLRNGVDLDLFSARDREVARRRLGITKPTLLSVGQLIERKGNEITIKALEDLPEFELIMVGEGPLRNRLEALAQKYGVHERVRFLGSISHKELPEIYSAADILVLASSREGWPNVLLEAMACGTPVIASKIWGNPEVVRAPEAGRLMDHRTPESLVMAVRALANHMPRRADTRDYAKTLSWEETSRGQIELFSRVIEHSACKATSRYRSQSA